MSNPQVLKLFYSVIKHHSRTHPDGVRHSSIKGKGQEVIPVPFAKFRLIWKIEFCSIKFYTFPVRAPSHGGCIFVVFSPGLRPWLI